jgi:hypothetical protein
MAFDWLGNRFQLAKVFFHSEISPFGGPGRVVFEAAAWWHFALRCLDG